MFYRNILISHALSLILGTKQYLIKCLADMEFHITRHLGLTIKCCIYLRTEYGKIHAHILKETGNQAVIKIHK